MLTHRFLLAVAMCVFGLLQSCAPTLPRARLIQPCRQAAQNLPIKDECTAAAIAERAFLEETHREITQYLISPMQHTTTQWYFMILLSDGKSPPADGGHYVIAVERATGNTEITPGV